jgi:AraC-like DNA-binding protein
MRHTQNAGDSKLSAALPTAGGGIARAAYARCVQNGIDTHAMLRKARLTVLQIENPEIRITVQSQIKFLDMAANSLGDEFLGFHLAQGFELREMGLLFYVMASSERLGDALHRGAHYSMIQNQGVRLVYRAKEDIAIMFEYVGVARHIDRHQIEFFMTTLVRMCRHLTGQMLQPRSVTLTHQRNAVSSEFSNFFGGKLEFGGVADEVVFSKSVENIPLTSADHFLNALLLKYCDEARSNRSTKPNTLRTSIENAIVPLLPHEKLRVSDISRELGLSKRTLARRMTAEGLSFSGILRDLRYDLAKQYLNEANLSISTIAWLLGYQQVSSFTHAFKRWMGKTPKQVRSGIES